MPSFSMRPAKYFYDKPLPKYLDPKTVLIYLPHPVQYFHFKLKTEYAPFLAWTVHNIYLLKNKIIVKFINSPLPSTDFQMSFICMCTLCSVLCTQSTIWKKRFHLWEHLHAYLPVWKVSACRPFTRFNRDNWMILHFAALPVLFTIR